MNDFRQDNRSRSGRDSFRREPRRDMFDAVCDECGKNCQVPFRPTSNKPIYCNECFDKRGGRDSRDSSRRSFSDRGQSRFPQSGQSDSRISLILERIEALNKKLDKVLGESSVKARVARPVEEKNKEESKPKKSLKKEKAKPKKADK